MKKNAFNSGMSCLWLPPKILLIVASGFLAGIHNENKRKLLLVMKMIIIIMTTCLLQVSAAGFAQRVTINQKNTTLENVFNQIRMQSGYNILIDADLLKNARPVNLNVKDVSVDEALKAVLQNQELTYSIKNKTIILDKKNPSFLDRVSAYLVAEVIKGRVKDENGKVLKGATIMVKGKRTAINLTNESGEFSVKAEVGDNITISYLGQESFTFTVHEDMNFQNIVLKVSTSQLREVEVSTGYQVLNKERATGSFAKPDMQVFSNRSTSMDLISRLDGQIPGLTVLSNPGATVADGHGRVRQQSLIRGTSSVWLSSEPLYVVNGVIVTDFSSINLDDVADITMLKDAAAAAIWGARAANGVIVVTTKTGSRNQKIKVSYSGFVNFRGKPDLHYQPVLNSQQFIQAAKETFDPVAYPWNSLRDEFIAPHEMILYNQNRGLISDAQANAGLDSLAGINNLDQIKDLWFRNALTTNHTVSASGGANAYSFYTSLGYTNTQSSTPGTMDNAYRIALNQEFNLNKRIMIALNTSLSNTLNSSKRPISIRNDFFPYQLFQDADGNSLSMPYIDGMSEAQRKEYEDLSRINLDYNPLNDMNYGHSSTDNLSVNITADATVKLWKGLSYKGTYGYLTSPGSSSSYDDHELHRMRMDLIDFTEVTGTNSAPIYHLPNYGGTLQSDNYNQRNWTVRNQLVYNYSGREGKDQLTLQGGQDAGEQLSTSRSNVLLGYDEALQTYALTDYAALDNGFSNTITGNGYYSNPQATLQEIRSRFTSYFGLASYTLNHRYSIDGSWRVDHSNLFGSDVSSQNKPVWSVGGKWNLSRENFTKQFKWLNDFQIRATYGVTGNSPYVGSATTYDIVAVGNFSYPQVAGKAYYITDPANSKLNWETTSTKNLGIDFAVLNSRLSGSVDFYRKNTTSLLGSIKLNPFTSFSSATSNIGNLTNNGLEISLRSVNVKSGDFSWSTGFVFSYNRNKLVSYSAPSSNRSADGRVGGDVGDFLGYSLSPLFAYRYVGLDNVGDPLIRLADGTITKAPDAATIDDITYMGTTIPVYNGGFTNNFRYKGFELALNMIFNLGAVMRRDVNQFYDGRLTGSDGSFGGNVSADFANRWKKSGDETITNIPAYTSDEDYGYDERNIDYYKFADINVVSASYVKLRDITLSYNLKPKLLQGLKIQNASLRMQVNNIMVWKANKYGIDPEYQSYSIGVRGMRNNPTITIGANLNF